MIKKRLLLPVIGLTLLLFAGCIREDRDDCSVRAGITFEYVLNDQNEDLFGNEVNKVTVYAFNEKGLFHREFSESGPALAAAGYTMYVDIEQGDYTLLVWGGPMNTYEIGYWDGSQNKFVKGLTKDKTNIDDFRIMLKEAGTRAELPNAMVAADLFYGKAGVTASIVGYTNVKITLIKNSSTVRFRITDISEERDPEMNTDEWPYDIDLYGRNTMLNSENNIPDESAPQSPELRYIAASQPRQTGELTWEVDYSMMRLMTSNHPVWMEIIDNYTGLSLLPPDQGELIGLIKAARTAPGGPHIYVTQEDFDREDLFEIELQVDRYPPGTGKELVVTIKINGWGIVDLKPGVE